MTRREYLKLGKHWSVLDDGVPVRTPRAVWFALFELLGLERRRYGRVYGGASPVYKAVWDALQWTSRNYSLNTEFPSTPPARTRGGAG